MNKRNIFLWVLYDFANSIVIVSFFLYLSQWLVIDGGLSSFWFNSIFVGSTILLLLSAPLMAAISDKIGRRKIFLNITTVGTFVFFAATAIVAQLGAQHVWAVAALYLLSQYFYQFSFVFYNPMIEELAPLEKRGRISGLGQTVNWIGQIAGVLIALPFASSGRIAPLLPATIIFFILALPMMIFFKENKGASEISDSMQPLDDPDESLRMIGTPVTHAKITIREIREEALGSASRFYNFLKFSPAAFFLISFFFFNDAILTLSNNFPIYMQKVFAVSDTSKSMMLLSILVMSAIGAYVSGWIADRIGMKRTMKIMLICWIILIPILAATTSFAVFVVDTVAVGFLYGSIWSVTRAYLSGILPVGEMNYGFSFYTLMERFATFAGPLSWGLIVSSYGENSIFGYRVAALSMVAFVIVGYFFIRKIPEYAGGATDVST
jgi:UMF1 family MFS transporter